MPDTAFADPARSGAFAPLRHIAFRMLWTATLTANVCMWMNDVAAAWMMTSLTTLPLMVALVQSASTLPVFLLGVPSGALADIVDRRRYFAATQVWVALTATILALAAFTDSLTAPLLLALTFANGIGLAMRWPVFAAIVPEVVPREQLSQALALNGIAMNASRVVGPIVAGALLASAGSSYVFGLNAVLSIGSCLLILRWKSEPKVSALPGERFVGAVRVGLQFVRQSLRMRAVLVRVSLFFLQSTALLALLPLEARRLEGGGAGTYTLLIASMGLGAVLAALSLPRLRGEHGPDRLVQVGTIVQAAATAVVAFATTPWLAVPAMFVNGMAWITTANSLTMAAQLALPNWVRARGMAIYQMALMGGSALGAALWGQVASLSSVRVSLLAAATIGLGLSAAVSRRFAVQASSGEEYMSVRPFPDPVSVIPVQGDEGPVMVTVEYMIDPQRADEFAAVMQETRRSRLQHGALSWGLFRDTAQPGRYLEYILDESWVEHLRRFERFTHYDVELREKRIAFHQGPQPPLVQRYVGERLVD
jgi:MFS family permease